LYATDLGVRKIKVHEDGYSYEASIDQQLIRGRVAIDINVVSLAHNANFQWEMQHSDYAGYEFDIQPGDILALGGVLEFDVEKDYDPMSPPLGSCFRIVRDQYGGRVVRVDFSDPDQVLIYVPEAIAQGLLNNSSYPDLQISSVVLPALMETIDKIWRNGQEVEEEDFSERGWFDSVKRKMDAVPDGGLFEVAQRMLDHPVERVITLSFLEEEGDD